MIVVPQGHQLIKYLLLGIFIIQTTFMVIKQDSLNIHKNIFILFLFYAIIGLSFGSFGYIQGNPGAFAIMKLTVVYLLFSLFFVININNIKIFKKINSLIIFSSIFLSLYIFITILNANGVWPDWLYYNISGEKASQGVAENSLRQRGRIDIGFSSLPSFLFLQPYLFTLIIVEKRRKKSILWIAFIVSTIIMLFGGSRILILSSLLFPILIIIYLKFFSDNNNLSSVNFKKLFFIFVSILVIATLILLPFGLRVDAYIYDMVRGFMPYELTNIIDGGKTQSAFKDLEIIPNRRITQLGVILTNLWEKPFFGYGSGSVAFFNNGELYLRNIAEPWKYELTYLQFLHHWGIVGFGIYLLGIILTFKKLLNIFNLNSLYSPYALAILFGSSGFLIGSSINPYITRFDSLFVIFLPIAMVNIWSISKDNTEFSSLSH